MKHAIAVCLLALVPAILSASINEENGVNAKVVTNYLFTTAGDINARKPMKASDASTCEGIKPDKTLYVLMHGFLQSSSCSFPADLKDAYLNEGSPAVIVVDWRDHANYGIGESIAPLYYPGSVSALPTVATEVADVLETCIKNGYTSPDMIHIVGVSLGAHLAGRCGDLIKQKTGQQVARITGLDPAGPSFGDSLGNNRRLQPGDAKFVDAIHTDAGSLGTTQSCGDVDYWPNNGRDPQPGCENESSTSCSHGFSARLMLDSIKGNHHTAHSCNSWDAYTGGSCNGNDNSNIGMQSSHSARGHYYAKTGVPVNWTGKYNCKD